MYMYIALPRGYESKPKTNCVSTEIRKKAIIYIYQNKDI